MKNGMQPLDEFMDEVAMMGYVGMWPWERYFYNRERKKDGLPPLRIRDSARFARRARPRP